MPSNRLSGPGALAQCNDSSAIADSEMPGPEEPAINVEMEDEAEAWENELAKRVCVSVEVRGWSELRDQIKKDLYHCLVSISS
jgi:hypothetical protein